MKYQYVVRDFVATDVSYGDAVMKIRHADATSG